jgi:xylulokinase
MPFLGLDLGTTGVRALLIDATGSVLGAATAELRLNSPAPGWMEQDPQDWWAATCSAIKEVLARTGVLPGDIAAIAASGQMHGATLLDEQGAVVRPCILWNDQRSAPQCTEITRLVGTSRLLDLTRNVPLAGFTAPKLLWVREHEPDRWARTAHVLLPRDYLNWRLTGTMASEASDAAGTLLFNVRARNWSTEMLGALELDPALLSEVVPSAGIVGSISRMAARDTGLLEGTPVMGGGADNACAAAGSGVLEPGQVLCSVGTSGTVVAPVGLAVGNPGHNVHLFCHVSPRTNYLMGVVLSAGGALRWFRDAFCPDLVLATQRNGTDAYAAITAEAATVPAGAEGLIFLPYLTGERTPYGTAAARGVFFGLSPRHTRGHMARAVIEGVSFALGQSLNLLREAGVAPSTVRLTGGGAKSPFWQQILADVFNCPVAIQPADEGPAYGAGLLAAVGAGAVATIEEAGARIQPSGEISPRARTVAVYEKSAEIFVNLYSSLEPMFNARLALDV